MLVQLTAGLRKGFEEWMLEKAQGPLMAIGNADSQCERGYVNPRRFEGALAKLLPEEISIIGGGTASLGSGLATILARFLIIINRVPCVAAADNEQCRQCQHQTAPRGSNQYISKTKTPPTL